MNEQVNGQATESFEDAIRTHLLENRGRLVQQAVSSAIEKMAEAMKYSAMEVAHKQMNEFFAKEVGPEVAKHLQANRETLVATVISTMKTVLDQGLKKQAEEWMKAMDSEYSRRKTIEKMFGGKGY